MALKLKGATLIESLTALAIITAVMGSAFTIYTQTTGKQNLVMKSRAILLQNSFELNYKETDLPNEFLSIEIEKEPYGNLSNLIHYSLIAKNKQGKIVAKKHYLKRKSTM